MSFWLLLLHFFVEVFYTICHHRSYRMGKPVATILIKRKSFFCSFNVDVFIAFSGSLNICAPPAPQHNPLVLQRFISTNSASNFSKKLLELHIHHYLLFLNNKDRGKVIFSFKIPPSIFNLPCSINC